MVAKLKIASDCADVIRMFMPSSTHSAVRENAIVAFCTALNTPVVNIEDIEVGPARAAILLSADDYGGLSLQVRVSLISSSDGVTFRFQDDPNLLGTHTAAIEAALSFAEGMGFLFDEDLVASGGPSGRGRALRIWSSLIDPDPSVDPTAEFTKAEIETTEPEQAEFEKPEPEHAQPAEAESDEAEPEVLELEVEEPAEDSPKSAVRVAAAAEEREEIEPQTVVSSAPPTPPTLELVLTDDLVFVDDEEPDCSPSADPGETVVVDIHSATSSFASEAQPSDSAAGSSAAVGSPVLTKFRGARAADRRAAERRREGPRDRRSALAEGKSSIPDESDSRSESIELARTLLALEEVGSEASDDTGFLTRLLRSF